VAAGIHRVVVACRDPDSRVNGAGIARLQAAGVIVEEGLLHEEARHLNREFFLYSNSGRPFITLKYAMTLDGHLACEGGDSRWISGEESRAFVHQLRKECQAVLIGNGTLERDDPTLDCRLPGIEGIFQPFPIILSSSGSVREAAQLWQRPGAMLVTTRSGAIRVGLHPQPRMVIVDDGAPLAAILQELGRQEIVSLLVEGGTQVLTGFLRERLVDRIVVFAAPKICGGHSTPVADLGIRSMADAIACRGSWRLLGPDACFDGEVVRDA
jgi:diaminohydroxyphosphoribosylaminopyrimidine deaminase/5-amino-6-(5-phosphoribosylamino)uracil reductase